MKAVLKYTDSLQDGRNVFRILAQNNIEILRTWPGLSIYPRITIRIENYDKLNELLVKLNTECRYEVRLVKVKEEE